MILATAAGAIAQFAAGLRDATLLGLVVGLIAARLVPARSCALPPPPRQPRDG